MTQNRLHGNEGGALIEQYGCEGVAKLVGTDFGLQVGSIRDPIENLLNLMNRHPMRFPLGHKQRRILIATILQIPL